VRVRDRRMPPPAPAGAGLPCQRAVQTAATNAKLNPESAQPIGLHDLRHSAAGLAFESLALNEVSRLLRHANSRVTATVYGGLSDEAAAGIGEKLKNAGFGA